MTQDQPDTAREAGLRSRPPALAGPKTILLHIQDETSLKDRLETALSLARASRGHVRCLHVTPIEAYVAFDTFGGVFVMNDVVEALNEKENALHKRAEAQLRNEDVPWDYSEVTGEIVGQLVRHGALADIIVTGREARRGDHGGTPIGIIGEMLYRSRTPLLIPGDDQRLFDPTGLALIGWNGSLEAANTVRSSIELLKLASDVLVLSLDEQKKDEFPATMLLEYLSRHGIAAELRVEAPDPTRAQHAAVAQSLGSIALESKASYLLIGGYGHSRVAEFVFGGVTRALLQACPVALVIGH